MKTMVAGFLLAVMLSTSGCVALLVNGAVLGAQGIGHLLQVVRRTPVAAISADADPEREWAP